MKWNILKMSNLCLVLTSNIHKTNFFDDDDDDDDRNCVVITYFVQQGAIVTVLFQLLNVQRIHILVTNVYQLHLWEILLSKIVFQQKTKRS